MEGLSSDILYLDRNENFDPNIKQYISSTLMDIDVSRYPDYDSYIRKLENFYDISSNCIIPVAGCTEAIQMGISCFLDKDSITILKKPTYNFAQSQIESRTKNIVYYSHNSKLLSILQTIKPKFFYLCNPNNPTGELIDEDFIIKIVKVCRNINCIIFIDETYYEFCNVTTINLVKKYSNVIVGRSFSKAWGCAGLRMGWLAVNSNLKPILERYRLKASINVVGCHVISKLIDNYEIIKKTVIDVFESSKIMKRFISDNRGRVVNLCQHTNFIYFFSKINFFEEYNTVVRSHGNDGYVVAVPPLNISISKFSPYSRQ